MPTMMQKGGTVRARAIPERPRAISEKPLLGTNVNKPADALRDQGPLCRRGIGLD
jgi:hypothetical protein